MSYKIPQNNQYRVSNGSDLVPNIQYVRNANMDLDGYISISHAMPTLMDGTTTADFGLLADGIKTSSTDDYKLITNDKVYDISLSQLSVTLDASAPTADDDVRFVGWKNDAWYFNATSDIYSLQSDGTTWDVENTDSIVYPELFVSRNTLCGANSSSVDQYTEANMNGTTPTGDNSGPSLTIPDNFDITGLSYSNYRMGVATENKTGGSAYFFVWNGATTDAQLGVPVNATKILDVVAYKNSWALLTSIGQLLYFNGAGFDVLGTLPVYYSEENWLSFTITHNHGRTMYTDGDIIYLNLASLMDNTSDDSGILPGFYSGVWCYDPDIDSLYHRYGLSHSFIVQDEGNATAGVYTYANHGLQTGDRIRCDGNAIKYAIRLTDNTYSIAESYDLAIAGTVSGTTYDGTKTFIKREDWTQLTAGNGSFGGFLKFSSGSEFFSAGVIPTFASSQITESDATATDITCIAAPVLENTATIIYQKLKSDGLQDTWNNLTIKHKPLYDSDKIIVKYKIVDGFKRIAVGEAGDISPDATNQRIAWTSATTFTTTKDLTGISVGDEVEFWAGAGAGCSAHITSISSNAGNWTVVVDESIRGASSGKYSTCLFDSFKKLGTITKDTTSNLQGQAKLPIGLASKWIQIKLELRGVGVTIEEMIVENKTHVPIQ